MRKRIILFSVVFFSVISCKQVENSDLKESLLKEKSIKSKVGVKAESDSTKIFKKFIPKGYSVMNLTFGDLNLDAYQDAVLIVHRNDEYELVEQSDEDVKRPLFILLGQPDKTFKLTAKNENIVYPFEYKGNPINEVVIKKGYFSIEQQTGGVGDKSLQVLNTITFKYSKKDNCWYLHKEGVEEYITVMDSTTMVYDYKDVRKEIQTVKDFGIVPFVKYGISENE